MKRRVVVTGMGVVCPTGDTVDEFAKNLLAGASGVRRRLSSIDATVRRPAGPRHVAGDT